ncbi:MAG TPA: hypothetical protein DHW82_08715 [Spirochaetia bacterium]|nr:MAG: hypothetical protein A2Y41_05070 [Spirochaetes bacterium GWB1_36_13]HCL57072.1 hypothetical protein [Spirochaetia bacterium]
MVMYKVLLVDENKENIQFFKEIFEKWAIDCMVVNDIDNSLLKINILKPDFIMISSDLQVNYENIIQFLATKNFKILLYGRKQASLNWKHIVGFKGYLPFPYNVLQFKNMFYSNLKNDYKKDDKESHIELVINDKIGVVDLAGKITWEQVHELKYSIIHSIQKDEILGIIFIFQQLENMDSDLTELIEHSFSFIKDLKFDSKAIKFLSMDKRIIDLIHQNPVLRKIEQVNSFAEAFLRLQNINLKGNNLGLDIDFLKENIKLVENVYDEYGNLIKKAGDIFSKEDIFKLRSEGITKIYYANELSYMGISIGDVSEVKKNIEEIIIRQAENASNLGISEETQKKANLEEKLVILVEDDKGSQMLIAKILDKLKCSYKIADNGRDALSYAIHYNPHLIILDLMMPKMNGVEFVKQYKELRKNLLAPIIVTSGVNKPEIIQYLLKTNVVKDFILKPIVDLKGFVFKILNYLV